MQNDLPEDLKEGWRIFKEWDAAMELAGDPLPPGGVFFINQRTILIGCLHRLRNGLAYELKIHPSCVKINLERDIKNDLLPQITVDYPDGWIQNVFMNGKPPPGQRAEEFAETYIKGVVGRYYEVFKMDVEERMESIKTHSRPDLMPSDIEDWLSEDETKTSLERRSN